MPSRKTVNVKIPIKAISTNRLYAGVKRRSGVYKGYRAQVLKWLEENCPYTVDFPKNMVLTMEVGFSSPLSDASNAVKGIEDVVAEYFGFNDRQIVTVHIDKYLVDKGSEYTHIKLRSTNKNIDRRTKRCQRNKRK
jgi:hypothetical protein